MPGVAQVQGFRGLNRAVAAALISPGESPDTTDSDFYSHVIGTLGARPGRSRVTSYTGYNYTGMGLLICQNGQRFRVTSTSDGKWHATGLAWPGLTTPSDLSDLTGKDGSETTRFIQYKERIYSFGKNRTQCCDGTVWTLAGIDKADFTPTVALGSTATFIHQGVSVGAFSVNSNAQFGTGKSKIGAAVRNPSGTTGGAFSYFVTACNSKKFDYLGRACESLPSTISNEILAQSGKAITVSGIPATHDDPQVDSWNVYRNKAGVYDTDLADEDQDFFLVGSVPLGTTSFTDTVPDYVLTGRNRLRFMRNVPQTGSIVELYGERFFTTGFKPIHGTGTQVKSIVTTSLTSDVATITTTLAHGFTVGQSVVISCSDANYNGTYTIVAIPTTTTFTYALVHANIGSTGNAGTAISPSVYIDISGVTLPDGCLNAWFQKDGDTARYLVAAVPSSSRVKILNVVSGSSTTVGFVGSLTGQGVTIFHKPHEIFITEFRDPEAAGPEIEVRRFKIDVPQRGQPTAMKAFGGSLLVFTHHNIFQISGSGPNREDIRMMPVPLFRGIGCVGPDALCMVGDSLFFMSTHGPMAMTGGAPVPIGAALNEDWYNTLTADELALCAMGSDDRYVYLSIPLSGRTGNSRCFRYHIQTQTWWEETGNYARQYIREDAEAGSLNTLFALQGRFIILPRSGTVDLASAGANGTVGATFSKTISNAALTSNVATITATAHGLIAGQSVIVACSDSIFSGTYTITSVTTDTFTYALTHANVVSEVVTGTASGSYERTTTSFNISGTFQTASDGLEDCTVRFYRAGVLLGLRRIISNVAHQVTWSSDATLAGAGALTLQQGDVWVIGTVCWRWLTRTTDAGEPMKMKEAQRAWVLFYAVDTNASILKNDIFNGTESTKVVEHKAKELVKQLDNSRANFTLALRIESRNGAILRAIDLDETVRAENR